MNLVTNAAEAIDQGPGTISVRTGVVTGDRDFPAKKAWGERLSTGKHVFLEVADTGCGMTEEVRERIFDPFFTTKFVGRGLGLAAVQGIIRGHKGSLEVRSEPGCGSTFKILFPCAETAVDEVSSAGAWATDLSDNSGTILVVDDEEVVRSMTKSFLEVLGFSVLTANDGREALEFFRRPSTAYEIDAVILDLSMPHMDGIEVFRELHRLRADLPILLSSGYNEREATSCFSGMRLAGFLHKPYTIALLKEKLHEVIARKKRT